MSTFTFPEERQEWYIAEDGLPTTTKHIDEIKDYTFDWTDLLGSETISTSTWDQDGPTLTNKSNTTTTTSVTVEGVGKVKNTVVTSGSQTMIRSVRFIGTPVYDVVDDYPR